MPFILSTGSNIGDKKQNLILAKDILASFFKLESKSSIFESKALDYIKQANFYNQLLQFSTMELKPHSVLKIILEIENFMGRERIIPKGPRIIDIDIIFWDCKKIHTQNLQIPHPRWDKRSFILEPLKELSFYPVLLKSFDIPKSRKNICYKI